MPKDLGLFIEKVVFALHPSFPKPTRVVTSPPFEVVESGWGEFIVGVQIFFKDPTVPSVRMKGFLLRLHHVVPGDEMSDTQLAAAARAASALANKVSCVV